MHTHPYLRAYLGGVFLPTLVLPIILTVFIVVRIVLRVPVPVGQVMIFPMAVVPSLFGLWNMLWVASHLRTGAPIGLHGAVLPLLMAPLGALIATSLGVLRFTGGGMVWFEACTIPYAWLGLGVVVAMSVYYLVWKYVIGYVDHVLGIA